MRSQIVIANAKPGEIVIVSRPDAVLVTMADIPESTWADQARGLSNDQSRTLIPLVRSSSKGDMSKGKGSFEFARRSGSGNKFPFPDFNMLYAGLTRVRSGSDLRVLSNDRGRRSLKLLRAGKQFKEWLNRYNANGKFT